MGIRISEIYASRQGEGRLTGQMSAFVRTSGCNLRCSFCDTPFTSWSPEGESYDVKTIVETVDALEVTHVVITGGEPMLPVGIVELTNQFHARKLHITIETAGTINRDVHCDLISISPKMSNSTPTMQRAGRWAGRHESTRQSIDTVQQLINRYDYQLKFVVVDQADVDEVREYCAGLDGLISERVMMMPEGIQKEKLIEREEWLKPVCARLGYTFCPRMHIHWYGNKRGT